MPAEHVAAELATGRPDLFRMKLATFLKQIPSRVRQSQRRPADPTGRTIRPGIVLNRPEDLIPFVPDQIPKFQSGDRPLAGVDWVLVELLGMGGFGEVWKARNAHFESFDPVALKFCTDPLARQRLLRHEAKVLDRVMRQGRHPGIVRLEATYLSADPPCLQYEYVEGGDLGGLIRDWYRQAEKVTPEQVARVMLQLAEIVAFTHQLDPPIVHRDLNPANVLVQQSKGGAILFKITDFGIGGIATDRAVHASHVPTSPREFLTTAVRGSGTILYSSPEQWRGEDPDPRDDVHALGVIWYQMLTGDLTEGRPSGSMWRDELIEQGMALEMVKLLESCFERPKGRPANAAVLAEGLGALLKTPVEEVKEPPVWRASPDSAARPTKGLPKPPVAEIKEKIVNSIGMKLKLIPAGEYRMGSKERTDNLTEVTILDTRLRVQRVRELAERKETILKAIETQGKLNPGLAAAIRAADNRKRLEDLYLPFKPKHRTKASEALDRGLELLALRVWNRDETLTDLAAAAQEFVNAEKGVESVQKVLEGVGHILAEAISEMAAVREAVRRVMWKTGKIVTSKADIPEGQGLEYRDYFNYSEPVSHIPSHRVLAINRGDEEKALRVRLDVLRPELEAALFAQLPLEGHPQAELFRSAALDALGRLILPSMEREVRRDLTEVCRDLTLESDDEKPRHLVTISRPFYLGVYTVTQSEYMQIARENPSDFSGGGRLPVENVSWFDAVAFCNTLSQKEGLPPFYEIKGQTVEVPDWNGPGYRLPTEAEWEFACRAGTTTRFSFGGDEGALGEYAWYSANSNGRTHPVGEKKPNTFGLFDMHGNVWEWCWDGYAADYYQKSPADDPRGPDQSVDRVFRGGSWDLDSRYSRSANRRGNTPTYLYNNLGFRVARVQSSR
jgi:formylglycine-generating enzyme required for sulfatase activity/serine/threonine protein kinase